MGWPSAMAPPFTLTLRRVELQLAQHGQALGGEGLVQLEEVDAGRRPAPAFSSALRTAGTGPMPMTFGSTAAEA